jgi:hypothetical protein
MISENILGETRKWRSGTVEWKATVIEVTEHFATVKLITKNGENAKQGITHVRWSAGELADHGFDIGTPS